MDASRLAMAERIVKVMARATSSFEGEARTAAFMARDLMEEHGFTMQELKFRNGFEPRVFEEWRTACEYYWDTEEAPGTAYAPGEDTDGPREFVIPLNFATKKRYQGRNIDRLSAAGFTSPYWMGSAQAKKRGGHVRRGEHGTVIYRWDFRDVEDEVTGENKRLRRCYKLRVFNAEQIDGINFPSEGGR